MSIFIFIVFLINISDVNPVFGLNDCELGRQVRALSKVLRYMSQRPQQMNLDAGFGLVLAQANLECLLEKIENLSNPEVLEILKNNISYCKSTLEKLLKDVDFRGYHEATIWKSLLQPNIWIHTINWSNGTLSSRLRHSSSMEFDASTKIIELFTQGSPNEAESDECVSKLIFSKINGNCRVDEKCSDMLLRDDHSRGYPLTHRLLYVQIAKALHCKEHPSSPFSTLIPSYCAHILKDLQDLEKAVFPSLSRDLIMEQIALCGMEGYLEFANRHYAHLIMSWAHPSGCFSAFGFQRRINWSRSRRSTNLTDFDCDNHATGVAAAVLSLLLREYLEVET